MQRSEKHPQPREAVMSDNIVNLDVTTRLDLSPEKVIEAARSHPMRDVVIVGYGKDGEFYFAGSSADAGTTIWLLEKAKLSLLDQ